MSHLAGVIVIWRGAIVDIPFGWALCDGNNGTPNLQNQFVVGAGDTYAVDDTGGALFHEHDFTGDGHDHSLPLGAEVDSGFNQARDTTTEPGVGTTDPAQSIPPYYALAYIMKV